jgi:cytochrome c biogenesis protein
MYHSWWFQFLILFLAANIVVCSVDRLSSTWKIVFAKDISFDAGKLRKSCREEFTDDRSPEELKDIFMPVVAASFKRHRMEKTDKGFMIFAERGRWTRLGVYAVHLSVILLLAGGMMGSIFGFDGSVNIPEGGSVKSIVLRNTGRVQPLDFEIRCDDFDVSFYESGAPKEYLSKLTILEDGKAVYKKDIIVNDPIRFKGVNIFQSSYGTLKPKEAIISFTNRETGMIYKKKAVLGDEIAIPEAFGKFVLKEYSGNFDFMGHNLGEAFLGILTPPMGEPVEVLLPLRFPSFDKMRKDRLIISVEGGERLFYTGLQVTRDPGVPVVYAGFIVMIIGCFISFFMSHSRICIEVAAKSGKSRVTVTGIANKNKLGIEARTKKISMRLSGKTDK